MLVLHEQKTETKTNTRRRHWEKKLHFVYLFKLFVFPAPLLRLCADEKGRIISYAPVPLSFSHVSLIIPSPSNTGQAQQAAAAAPENDQINQEIN